MKPLRYAAWLLLIVCLVSCTTTKENNLAYFKNLPEASTGVLPQGTGYAGITVQPDDELTVTINSLVPEATAMYNAPLNNAAPQGDNAVQSVPRLATFLVDKQGDITLPVIGRMHVAGMTTAQIEQAIAGRVAENVKDPYVMVRLQGFFVNVMGEVKAPQRIQVTRERFTVLDALASCGDLTEWGERNGVIVIRQQNGQPVYHRIDLQDSQMMASQAFYLQQNDVVYVTPNKIKIDNSKYNQNNAFKLSVISTIVSAASVVASLVIALTVK